MCGTKCGAAGQGSRAETNGGALSTHCAVVQPGLLIDQVRELIDLDARHEELPSMLDSRQIEKLNNKLERCRAATVHLVEMPQIEFSIASITRAPAARIKFKTCGRSISVAAYFARQYGPLKFPGWPCVRVDCKNPTYFPLEVVNILNGSRCRGEQTAPNLSGGIKARVKTFGKNTELDCEFDTGLTDELKVSACILPPPRLQATQSDTTGVNRSVADFRSARVNPAPVIRGWTVVIIGDFARQDEVHRFAEVLRDQASRTGVQLGDPLKAKENRFHSISDKLAAETVKASLESFVENNLKSLHFLLFVVGESAPPTAAIRDICDVKFGVRSACVNRSTIRQVLKNRRPGPDQVILRIVGGLNSEHGGDHVVECNTDLSQKLLSSCPALH